VRIGINARMIDWDGMLPEVMPSCLTRIYYRLMDERAILYCISMVLSALGSMEGRKRGKYDQIQKDRT